MAYNVKFEQDLNPEQLAAAMAPDGPILVLAAAGTGKTRTLVYRVAHLVTRGVEARRILLLTFTNKAAREMLERADSLVGQGVSGLWGGTFHHMANRILRRFADKVGFGLDFTIMDSDDSRSLIRKCMRELPLPEKGFPKPEVLHSIHSAAINRSCDPRDLLDERFLGEEEKIELALRVFKMYGRRKAKMNAMDFDDLLVNALRLFRENADVLARFQDQFMHVLVDEYQDTNSIQAEWTDLIAAGRRNILAVGDDFQSIYGWRGADFRNILSFPRRYSDCRKYILERNYRSTPGILNLANKCISHNPRQFQKTLYSEREDRGNPVLAVLRDGEHQAAYVAQKIAALRKAGCRASDIAVLYRAHFHAMELQRELLRAKVPHVVVSGVRFFEQAHVKDACALLRLIKNPADEQSFSRLLCMLPNVGDKTAAKIWTRLGGRFEALDPARRKQLLDALPAAATGQWRGIDGIFAAYEPEHLESDPGEAIVRFVKAFYKDYANDTFDEPVRRLEDLDELARYTVGFDSTEAFLSEMSLLTNLDAETAPAGAEEPESSVRLSTIHQAKGLEWKVVFLLWAVEGMFPNYRSMTEQEDEDEERRLFYVCVTRAKDELFVCAPEVRRCMDGSVSHLELSRFAREIPRTLFRMERPVFL